MTALINMAYSKDDDGAYDVTGPSEYSQPKYPCGLCLYLSEEQCEKLGISSALEAGTAIRIEGEAIVTRSETSLSRDGDGNEVSLSLQITDLSVEPLGTIPNAAEKLYGSN